MNKTATPRTKDQGLAPTPSMVTVGPGLDRLLDCNTRKPNDSISLALNGHSKALRFWIYGRIEYRDGFCRRKPYLTTFCFYWKPLHSKFHMSGPYNNCT